jgi:hypothetical protein|tara:strand:+ start:973 stop:1176 length:204 start_codon:yes stop_codon:yes gene_type:complete
MIKKNKILELHSKWLFDNDCIDEWCSCVNLIYNDRRDKHGKKFKIRNKEGQFIKIRKENIENVTTSN